MGMSTMLALVSAASLLWASPPLLCDPQRYAKPPSKLISCRQEGLRESCFASSSSRVMYRSLASSKASTVPRRWLNSVLPDSVSPGQEKLSPMRYDAVWQYNAGQEERTPGHEANHYHSRVCFPSKAMIRIHPRWSWLTVVTR